MERRSFFGWMGKIALVVGSGYLLGHTEVPEIDPNERLNSKKPGERPMRMNARACRDYRMISADRSMVFDREILNT
jgi:hypothetical protein